MAEFVCVQPLPDAVDLLFWAFFRSALIHIKRLE